jgi:uncharacterized damage-inducible protein DinB
MKDDILGTSQYVSTRTRQRLEGLTDDELFWEPVADCWSVRLADDGTHRADGSAGEGDGRFTTIAWRLWHLTSCYGSVRNADWLGVDRRGEGFEQDGPVPSTASTAVAALEQAGASWHEVLDALPADAWASPLGSIAGPYGEASKASFVLHQLDEQIHHGAELGVLRDLYRSMR